MIADDLLVPGAVLGPIATEEVDKIFDQANQVLDAAKARAAEGGDDRER